MSIVLTSNDIKYKGIVLNTPSVYIKIEPLTASKKAYDEYDENGDYASTYYVVKCNTYVTKTNSDEDSQKLDIDNISTSYHLKFIHPNDLNIQYAQIHASFIEFIEELNPNWVDKMIAVY